MATEIVSDFLGAIDNTVKQFVETVFNALGTDVKPIFMAMLTVYIIWWGYQMFFGRAVASPLDATWRLARAMAIYWLATNWGAFSETAYKLVQAVPEWVGSRIVQAVAAATGQGDLTGVGAIPKVFDAIYEGTQQIVPKIYSGSIMDIMGALIAIVLIVCTILFIGVAVAAIVAAKVMVGIVCALAPLFIILMLFNYTMRYTDSWINTAVNLVVLQILVYGFLGFYYHMVMLSVNAMVGGPAGSDVTSLLSYIMPVLLTTIIGFYVLLQLPTIAGMLTGSASMNATGAAGDAIRRLRMSSGLGMKTGRAGYQTARAAVNTTAAMSRPVAAGINAAGNSAARHLQRQTMRNSSPPGV